MLDLIDQAWVSLESSSTDCLTAGQGRHAQFQDIPKTLHHRSLLHAVNSCHPGSLAPLFWGTRPKKGAELLRKTMAKSSQPHIGSCLSENFCVMVFRELVLSRFTMTLCMTRGAGTQCWLLFQFHDSQAKNLSFKKRKLDIIKIAKHRDHHLGQILKMSSGTIKKPQTVYILKKCFDAFKGFSSQILDNIEADISTLLLYTSSIF